MGHWYLHAHMALEEMCNGTLLTCLPQYMGCWRTLHVFYVFCVLLVWDKTKSCPW